MKTQDESRKGTPADTLVRLARMLWFIAGDFEFESESEYLAGKDVNEAVNSVLELQTHIFRAKEQARELEWALALDVVSLMNNVFEHIAHLPKTLEAMQIEGRADDFREELSASFDKVRTRYLVDIEKLAGRLLATFSLQRGNSDISEVYTELQTRIIEELSRNPMKCPELCETLERIGIERDESTVKRALKKLSDEGVVANQRGLGYYLVDSPPKPITDTD